MRYSELCEKEVVNVNDCKCFGTVRDIDFDPKCGEIIALIVPGPPKYFGCLCHDFEYWIPWCKIIKIGPDIILVDMNEKEMKRNCK